MTGEQCDVAQICRRGEDRGLDGVLVAGDFENGARGHETVLLVRSSNKQQARDRSEELEGEIRAR